MKICHAFTRIRERDGGLVRALVTLAGGLADAGHEVTIVTSSDSEFPSLPYGNNGKGPSIAAVDPVSRGVELFGRRELSRIAARFDAADVLHLHGMWRPAAHQIAALARRMGKPYVVTVHGRLDRWSMRRRAIPKRIFYWLFERADLGGARRVHVTARAERDQAHAWIPHGRIAVIPYLFDFASFEHPPDRSAFLNDHPDVRLGPTNVVFLSRLHPKKGPEVLIDAVGMLQRRGVPCRLLVAGPGEPRYVGRLRARAAQQAPDSQFVGMVHGEAKLSLLALADVLALPTHQENFGLVLTEALACGTPVVTTRGTDIWPELAEYCRAVLVERRAVEFADALETLLSDPQRRSALGSAGRAGVRRWLDPGKLIAAYEAMYREAIDGEP